MENILSMTQWLWVNISYRLGPSVYALQCLTGKVDNNNNIILFTCMGGGANLIGALRVPVECEYIYIIYDTVYVHLKLYVAIISVLNSPCAVQLSKMS